MKLNRWVTLLTFAGAMASGPLFAQDFRTGSDQGTGMSGSSEAQKDMPWADQQASLDAVKKLQEALKEKGHDAGPVDGLIGPRSETALRDFQNAEGLDASGEINAETLTALDIDRSEFAAFGIKDDASAQESPGAMDRRDSGMPDERGDTQQRDVPESGMRN